MTEQTPNNICTQATQTTDGDFSWTNAQLDNLTVDDDTNVSVRRTGSFSITWNNLRLVTGVPFEFNISDNFSNVAQLWSTSSFTTFTFGGSSDMLGVTGSHATPQTVNGVGFGLRGVAEHNGEFSHSLIGYNFGFSVPTDATLTGYQIQTRQFNDVGVSFQFLRVAWFKITVFYVLPSGVQLFQTRTRVLGDGYGL